MESMMVNNRGFTLIELMVVIVIVAILAAIAIPSYQNFIQRRDLAIARQEALDFVSELEKFKSKNFSFKGFDASYFRSSYNGTAGTLNLPVDAVSADVKYVLKLRALEVDKPLTDLTVNGLGWVMIVERARDGVTLKQPTNFDLLLTSNGLRCMSTTNNAFGSFVESNTTCVANDSNSEAW